MGFFEIVFLIIKIIGAFYVVVMGMFFIGAILEGMFNPH
jgi:hypothetical protein